jgi:hypothetical protein
VELMPVLYEIDKVLVQRRIQKIQARASAPGCFPLPRLGQSQTEPAAG